MSYARWVSTEEFDRDWAAIRRSVLGREELVLTVLDGDPFNRPDWPKVAIEDGLLALGQSDYPQGYPEALKLDYPYFPLLRTLEEFGVTEICLSTRAAPPEELAKLEYSPNTVPWPDKHMVLTANMAGLELAKKQHFQFLDQLAFSREGNWGLVADLDGFSILAAEPAFIDAYYRNAGGERAAQLRFYWFDDECGDYKPKAVYEIVGWPVPHYTIFKPDPFPKPMLGDPILWEAPWRSEMT